MKKPTKDEIIEVELLASKVQMAQAELAYKVVILKEKHKKFELNIAELSAEEKEEYFKLQLEAEKAVALSNLAVVKLRAKCEAPSFAKLNPRGQWVYSDSNQPIIEDVKVPNDKKN